jgi:hypothetical protein
MTGTLAQHKVLRYDRPMTTKADFTEEEWARLKRAPLIAGLAISLADPGGPIEAIKESAATLKTVTGAADSASRGDLVGELARAVGEEARQRKNPLAGFKPRGAQEVVDELRAVNGIVSQKATPEEAEEYRSWLLAAAKEAADAAKEGGFLGFRAERVSEGEQRMLDELARALAAPA